MKYVKQFMIISVICFLAELLNYVIPLPVPASIYGLVLMFLSLEFKLVKLEQVEDVAGFLLAVMPVMFIDPNVKLMTIMGVIKGELIQILLMVFLSTMLVTGVTGRVAQSVIRMQKKRGKE